MPKVTDPALVERLNRAAAGLPPPPDAAAPVSKAVQDPELIARLNAAAGGMPSDAPYQPNEFERAWAGIKTGFVGVAAGASQAMAGEAAANPPTPTQAAYQQRGGFSAKVSGMYAPEQVEAGFDALPADAYSQSAEQSARSIAEWTNEWMQRNAPDDPKYRDNLYSAVGSMAAIAGPAAVMTLLGGPKGGEVAAALIESAAEQGAVERELITRFGMSAADAHEKSLWVFGVNLPMNFMLDKGLFRALPGGELGKKLAAASGAKAIAKVIALDAGLAGLKEGAQEVAQEAVSTKAVGDKQDLGRLAVAGSTGFLVGGLMTGAGAPMAAASGRQQTSQEPAAVAPTGQELANPAIPTGDMPLPADFDLFVEPEEAAGAPTAAPAEPEAPSPAVESPVDERPAEPVLEPQAEPTTIGDAARRMAARNQPEIAKPVEGGPAAEFAASRTGGSLAPARARAALSAKRRFNGVESTVQEYVEQAVASGAVVGRAEKQPVLMNPDGSYIRQSELTKTGIDYAQFLSEREQPAPAQPESAPSEPATVAEPAGSPAVQAEAAPGIEGKIASMSRGAPPKMVEQIVAHVGSGKIADEDGLILEATRIIGEKKALKSDTPISDRDLSRLDAYISKAAPTSVGKRDDVMAAIQQTVLRNNLDGDALPAVPSTKQQEAAAAVAEAFGAEPAFFSHGGKTARLDGARIVIDGRKPIVAMNVKSENPVLTVASHEVAHVMETSRPDLWSDVYQVLNESLKPGARDAWRADLLKRYGDKGKIPGEMVAEAFGEAARRESFWTALAERNPEAFRVLVAQVKRVMVQVRKSIIGGGYSVEHYFNDFAPVETAIAKALSQMTTAERAAVQNETDTLASVSGNQQSTGRAVMDRLKGNQASAKARIKARERRWRDFPRVLYQKMVDRNTWHYVAMKNALKAAGMDVEKYDMAKNPHLVLQRMAAWTEKADLALRTAVLSWDGSQRLSDGLEPIIRKFKLAEAIDNGDFGQFMIAARLKAMHDVLGDDFFGPDTLSDGSPNPEYIAAEAEFGDYMEVYNEFGTQEWQNAATAMTEWSNAIMQRLLESGAISREQYEGMVEKYDIYAPLYVLEREEENRTGAGSKPKPTAGRVTWQMDRLVPGQVRMDPVEGMIKNVYRIEFLAANNSAKLAAADFIADLHKKMTNRKGNSIPGYGRRVAPKVNPVTKYVGDLLKTAGLTDQQIQDLVDSGQVADLEAQANLWVTSSYLENGVVALMRNGQVEYWQFEPDIYNVFAAINDKASHQLMNYFTIQTRFLRAGAVLTPEFMARNQLRDFLSAGVLATNLVKNPIDAALLPIRIMRGLSHAIKKDDIWQQFIMSGAGQANLVSLDQENLKKEVDQITREARTPAQRARQAVRRPVKYVMHSHPVAVLQAFSKLTENSTRLAVWEKTYNDAVAAGKSLDEARAMAAIQAREASTDFGRAGEYGRVINRIIPFFNAAIQGNDKMIRALTVDKGNRGATWLRGVAMVTLPSVLLWAINRDEEWYKEQPAWLKNHFWLFSVDGGRTIVKLPKPFEIGMIFGSLPERFLDYAYGEDPKAVGRWADSLMKDVGILQPGSFGGPLISTLVEIEQNYDAYRGTPIVKGWLQDVVPREQYTANTSEFAKWLGENHPGGRMSPLMVDHFIRGSFGGLGAWGAEIASNIIMEADPERREMKPASRLMFDKVPDWAPVLRGVAQTGPTSYTQDLDDLYDEFDRTREAVTTLRSFKSGGAPKEKYLQLYRERGVDLSLNEAVSRGIEPIAKISQQIKFIQSVPANVMDRSEKRARIDELMDMRNTLVREFMAKYRTIDRDSIQARVDASIEKVGLEFDRTKGR